LYWPPTTSNYLIGFSLNLTSYQQVNKSTDKQPEQQPATKPESCWQQIVFLSANIWLVQRRTLKIYSPFQSEFHSKMLVKNQRS
jgi:hypothetical protein